MQERLRDILKRERLTAAQFADAIGVQRSSVSHILSGRNKPGFDFINKILATFPSVDANWLITGTGKQVPDQENNRTLFREEPGTSGLIPEKPVQEVNKHSFKEEKGPELPPRDKEIEKILVFYRDKSFREYIPDKS